MSEKGQHENELEQEQTETVVISNEEGEEETFQVLYRFESDEGQKYIFLTPMEELEIGQEKADDKEMMEQEVYAFRYEGDGEQFALIPIQDEKEWDMVEEVLNTLEAELGEDEES